MFGLTFEELTGTAQQQAAHVRKVRVLLMREDSLDKISHLTLHKNGGEVELQSKSSHHEDRFNHLQEMARQWRQDKKRGKKRTGEPRSYLGTVRLCVPDQQMQELHQEVRQLRAELQKLSPRAPAGAGFSGMAYSSSAASLDSPSQTLDDSAASRELLLPTQTPDSHAEQASIVELDRGKGSLRFRSSAQAVAKAAYQADTDDYSEEPVPEPAPR